MQSGHAKNRFIISSEYVTPKNNSNTYFLQSFHQGTYAHLMKLIGVQCAEEIVSHPINNGRIKVQFFTGAKGKSDRT